MTEWRQVEGAKHYQVSDDGRVRSIDRLKMTSNGQLRRYRGVELSWTTNQHGHRKVPIRMDDGTTKLHYIHSLVALAFIGPRPEGAEVAHNDGDHTNNTPSNLRYATPKGNQRDKVYHGTHLTKERHPGAKLDEAKVAYVRRAIGMGFTQKDIAEAVGVCRTTISAIATGRTWK